MQVVVARLRIVVKLVFESSCARWRRYSERRLHCGGLATARNSCNPCNSWEKSCYQLPRFLIVLTSIFVMISRQISVIIRVHPWTSFMIIRAIRGKPRPPHRDLHADHENLNDPKAAIGLYFKLLLNFSLDIKANFISLNTLIPESRETSNHKLLKLRS
jgi:hypothetical protein